MVNVLFVDDEIMILNSLRRSLRHAEFGKFYANSGKEALKIIEEEEIGVVVSDMKMPRMNGLELMIEIQEIKPYISKIILSGYSQLPQVIAAINHVHLFRYITKPWNLEDELIPAIHEAIEYYEHESTAKKKMETTDSQNQLYKNILNRYDNKIKKITTNMGRMIEVNLIVMDYWASLTRDGLNDERLDSEYAIVKYLSKLLSDDLIAYDKKLNHNMLLEIVSDFVKGNNLFTDLTIENEVAANIKISGDLSVSRAVLLSFLSTIILRGTDKRVVVKLIDKMVENERKLLLNISVLEGGFIHINNKVGYYELLKILMQSFGGEFVYKEYDGKLSVLFIIPEVDVSV